MPSLEERTNIAASAERVFARLADPERGPEWTPNLLSATRTSEAVAGPGVTTRIVARIGGRESHGIGRCVDWDPPRRLVLESRLDVDIRSVTTFELDERDGLTQLRASVEYELPSKGLGRLVGGLFGDAMARRDLRAALASLKTQLEREEREG
ncbi:MAG: SRPBCC family protein [Chloroflexi bacterium]|nr:SRPBCC family protein [Chloroflexota bacterium]